jgi:chromosome segregation ATPase
MRQSDGDLLKSLGIARQELSARLSDRCADSQLWNDTVAGSVIALGAAQKRLQELFGRESESNRKLSEAEYKQREVSQWQQVKDGVEARLEQLAMEAARDKIANVKRAAELFESVETEHVRLNEYQGKLDERQQALDQREARLHLIAKMTEESLRRAESHNRHAEDYHNQLRRLQEQLESNRVELEGRRTATKEELSKQQKLSSEIERNAQGYRDKLKESEDIKQKANGLLADQANALARLNNKITEYEQKEYQLTKREDFVMQKWDETCRQVAHLRLPVELQGMPTP